MIISNGWTTRSLKSPYIEVRPGIFIIMGFFDILGTFRIFLCGGMLYRFAQKLHTQGEPYLDDKVLIKSGVMGPLWSLFANIY